MKYNDQTKNSKLGDPKTAATAEMMLKALPETEEKSETSLSGNIGNLTLFLF